MLCWTNYLTNTHPHNWRFSLLLSVFKVPNFWSRSCFVPHVNHSILLLKPPFHTHITNSPFLLISILSISLNYNTTPLSFCSQDSSSLLSSSLPLFPCWKHERHWKIRRPSLLLGLRFSLQRRDGYVRFYDESNPRV